MAVSPVAWLKRRPTYQRLWSTVGPQGERLNLGGRGPMAVTAPSSAMLWLQGQQGDLDSREGVPTPHPLSTADAPPLPITRPEQGMLHKRYPKTKDLLLSFFHFLKQGTINQTIHPPSTYHQRPNLSFPRFVIHWIQPTHPFGSTDEFFPGWEDSVDLIYDHVINFTAT